MNQRPNILFLFADQHRGDALGCLGPPAITPNLDRLAAEGVHFTRCLTNSPLCMPARASLITGQYVSEHGVWDNNVETESASASYVRNLKKAGYRTAFIGKAHLWKYGGLKNDIREKESVMQNWGFVDVQEQFGPMGTTFKDSSYSDYLQEKSLLDTHRKYNVEYVVHHKKFFSFRQIPPRIKAAIDKYVVDVPDNAETFWVEPPTPLDPEDTADAYAGLLTSQWLDGYTGDQPFYLQVGFPGPHTPFDSPAMYRKLYSADAIPLDLRNPPTDPIAPHVRRCLETSGSQSASDAQLQALKIAYYAKISLIDHTIGEILKTLEAKGLLENTWIIYSSDHGEMLGDHGLQYKRVFYDGALRIPLIIRPPGGVEGWRSNGLCDQLDIAATLSDIGGAKPLEHSDGRSLRPQITAGPEAPDARKGKDLIFSEVNGFTMVMNERYRMTIDVDGEHPVELFDLEKDPLEQANLAHDPALEQTRLALMNEWRNRLLPRLNQERFKDYMDHRASNDRP